MGGGKKNKSKKSKSNNPAPAPKEKKKLTGLQRLQKLGRAPKTLGTSPSAIRFKERVAAGLDGATGMRKVTDAERKQGKTQLTQYRDAQRKWVSDQAAKRNAAYRAEKNKSATQKQVDRDNALYGNTFPSGSISISEDGKKQAEANKAEARRKSMFDPNRLSFNMDSNPFVGQSFLAAGYNQPGRLGSWFDKGLNVRVPNEANASFGRLFKDDMSQLGKFTNKQGKVEGGLFNTGIPKNFRQLGQLFSGKGGLGFSFGSGIGTGPTPLGRQAVRRFLPYAGQISLGRDIFNYGGSEQLANFADNTIGKINPYAGTTDQSPELNAAAAARERGPLLSIGNFKVPEFGFSEFMGINTVDRTPKDVQVASTDAGGLNIGGTDTESGTKSESNDLGRTLSIGDKIKILGGLTSDAITQGFGKGLGDGTLTGNMDFAGNLPGDKGFNNKDVQIKGAFNAAMNSKAVQQLGEGFGLPKNFKDQLKDTASAGNQYFSGMTTDRDSIYSSVSDTLRDLTSNPKLGTTARFINQLTTDNPNVSDSERDKKVSIFGINTPLTNETIADIRSAFDEKNKKFEGLSMADRGFFEGGGGNRLVSGKLTDTLRGVLSGYKNEANIGLPKGEAVSLSNLIDAAPVLASNLRDKDSLASKRINEIQRLAPGGDITTPSLIKGQLPQFGQRRTGGKGNTIRMGGGGGNTPLSMIPDTIIPEVLPLPTTTAQGGTNATDLASIQQQAYNNQMSIYGMNPNYFAQIQQPRFNRPTTRFRNVFNRGYF